MKQKYPQACFWHTDSTCENILGQSDLIIDALLGTGLQDKPKEPYAKMIHHINQVHARILSIDMPSGLFGDEHTNHPYVVKANTTLSFQFPKRAFFFAENSIYVGKWQVLDIGLSMRFIQDEPTSSYYVTNETIQSLIKPRPDFGHKGHFGHGLLMAGSKGKMGAAVLAARSYLRSGAGLLTTLVPMCGDPILQTAVPEAMTITAGAEYIDAIPDDLSAYRSIGIGPGMGNNLHTLKALEQLLNHATCPLVLDADALNILAAHPSLLVKIPKHSILTPHPKEFERLVGKASNDFERFEQLKQFAQSLQLTVVLKGKYTCVASADGNQCFNTTGNNGLAKGGSGDILTGLLTGLLAQGYSTLKAALIGVYWHGKAADLAATSLSEYSMIPSDVVEYYGKAMMEILSNP